ncbi:hypothetical protein B0T24DRAFT_95358 [Lasiosphaeria ovina]|uniref:Uncharacterized protein n=1 Tax=Lasiosphaeria ovina TaxID=92902 RepID=A0AAE0JTU0_9PEZI|nr:hypothetical protein B0T24DRAFT_95358 [Lasiosphaeria ovina]
MRFFTMGVITHLGYSKSFGHLDEGEDVYGRTTYTDDHVVLISLVLDIPIMRSLLFSRYGLAWLGHKPDDKIGVGKVMRVIHDIVSERLQNGAKLKNDMVRPLAARNREPGHAPARRRLRHHNQRPCSILMFLCATPNAYAKLKREIRDDIASSRVASDRPITNEQALKLPYLQAHASSITPMSGRPEH